MKRLAQLFLALAIVVMAQASYSLPTVSMHHPHCRHIDCHHECEHTSGCYWDHHTGSCHRYGGGSSGGHHRCYNIGHYHRCVNTQGCFWDRYERRCLPEHSHHN